MYYYNLPQLFNKNLEKYTNNKCINDETKTYSFLDLDLRSNQFAYFFQEKNISQGDVIIIVNTKSFDSYAVMLACLKIGAPYVNIDNDNPLNRNKNIVETCTPKLVITDKKNIKIKELCNEKRILYFETSTIELNSKIHFNNEISNNIDGDSIAYIMFTSGSTGKPKGAAITHQALLHFIEWARVRFSINSKDNFANFSPMYFDNSVFDFYAALFNGASLTPISKELLQKPVELINYVNINKCTIWFSVPSLAIYLLSMKVFNKDYLNSVRLYSFGGEGFPKKELKKLYDLYHQNADFYIVYGPTECTCICSSYKISKDDFSDLTELPSLGNINPNFSYEILDSDNKLSNEGELCLIGPNVGLGYYNDSGRTKESFLKYPNSRHYRKRMYKTGDLVIEKNGLLYFKGRKDFQIKHMGYRIELEDIETALNTQPEIIQSAVLYHTKGSYGKIVAYVASDNLEINSQYLKNKLVDLLPIYMIPSKIFILKELPKNANGKVDRVTLKSELLSN